MNYERTTPNKRSRAKDTGFSKIKENDTSQINLSYPYVVLMLSEKNSINGLLNNKNF